MNTIVASLLAMIAGWGTLIAALTGWQFATAGRTTDIGVTAFWIGIFSSVAWLLVVLPIVANFGTKKLMSNLRWSWMTWSVLGALTFSIILPPLFGKEVLVAMWCPAIIGAIAGLVYALLIRPKTARLS